MTSAPHAHLGSGAVTLGVAAGFVAALASAVSYFISRHHSSRGGSSFRLLVIAHALMGAACLPTAWLLWPAGLPPAPAWIAPLLGSSCSYLGGQAVVFAALARADTSRVAPLLGLKIAMLACIVSCLPGEPLDLRQWLAVGLSIVAALMLQRGGGMRPAAVGFTLAACVAFAVSDLCIVALIDGLQRTAAEGGVPLGRLPAGFLAMLVTYATCGAIASCGLVAAPAARPFRRLDWVAGTRYAITWLVGMAGLYVCFGLVGAVFGNIVQSTRGLFSIVIGATLAHAGWHGLESRVDRRTLTRRLLAAGLMTAAIALYVIDIT
ncbi:MAG: DMT family transporter [Planctomycetes bacterium]|nr:DMT family transporter [Planctomycetota bacterium]